MGVMKLTVPTSSVRTERSTMFTHMYILFNQEYQSARVDWTLQKLAFLEGLVDAPSREGGFFQSYQIPRLSPGRGESADFHFEGGAGGVSHVLID